MVKYNTGYNTNHYYLKKINRHYQDKPTGMPTGYYVQIC